GSTTTPSSCSATWTRTSTTSEMGGCGAFRSGRAARSWIIREEHKMYITPEGKEIFVIDGHTHFWDGSPENQRNIHGKQFVECFYAYHTNLSPKDQLWEKSKFEKYSADDLY